MHTNAVNVFVNAAVKHVWKVVVDDVHDVANVKTAGRDTSSDEDGTLAGAERTATMKSEACGDVGRIDSQRILTFALSTIRVNRGCWHSEIEQEVIKEVDTLLGVAEDECARGRHV